MVEFYHTYLNPSSPSRARISVHLKARGAGDLDGKILKLLANCGVANVPQENRQSVDLLRSHLEKLDDVPADEVEKIVLQVKEMGLSQDANNEVVNGPTDEMSAVDAAREITDVRQFRAGLPASSGARPVKPISEFEENEPKL